MTEPARLETLLPAGTNKTITIKSLENAYRPSEFPHSKIISELREVSNSSSLARAFHVSETTLCMGCHHAAPVAAQARPAACKNCHTVTPATTKLNQPRLLAAYHLQCVGCHKRMEMKEQGCTDCHESKKRALDQVAAVTTAGGKSPQRQH